MGDLIVSTLYTKINRITGKSRLGLGLNTICQLEFKAMESLAR